MKFSICNSTVLFVQCLSSFSSTDSGQNKGRPSSPFKACHSGHHPPWETSWLHLLHRLPSPHPVHPKPGENAEEGWRHGGEGRREEGRREEGWRVEECFWEQQGGGRPGACQWHDAPALWDDCSRGVPNTPDHWCPLLWQCCWDQQGQALESVIPG